MSKKKGLSLEDKRQKLMEIFYEKKDCFQLKEVEKYASKEKKINAQVVKEILQSLVDDDLVTSEKIGSSIYYWSFPSQAGLKRNNKLIELEKENRELLKRRENLEKEISISAKDKEESDEKINIMKLVEINKLAIAQLNKDLSLYKNNDPRYIAGLEKQNVELKNGINIWTDNLFSTISWLKTKFGVDEATIKEQFNIPENLDYFE